MARAPRSGGMISRRGSARPTGLMNFHNQGLLRAEGGGPGSGFTVEFLAEKAMTELRGSLEQGAVAIRASSFTALVAETDETKQKMRAFLDAHFDGSDMHGNGHRRVSNAAVQSVYYDDLADKGQITSLIYSKFGVGGGAGFVDFLLLHMKGGTIKPKSGDWLRIPASGARRMGNQSGYSPTSRTDVFFVESKDGKKLYQLRRPRRGSAGTELLATLMKSITIKPSLGGLERILADRGAVFERHFTQDFEQRFGQGAG